jgi:hypothetical protein
LRSAEAAAGEIGPEGPFGHAAMAVLAAKLIVPERLTSSGIARLLGTGGNLREWKQGKREQKLFH